MLGRFLEVSIHCPDVLESLRFYESIGFSQAPVGETWKHPYAVVTDGRLSLGLHAYEFVSPSLTWVQPDLRRHAPLLESAGIEFEFLKLGDESFNELGFLSPEGQMITLLEARTYSPVARRATDTSMLDWFEEMLLPCRDAAASVAFWERLGFVAAEESDRPVPHVGLTSDSLNVALTTHAAVTDPLLVFRTGEPAARRERLGAAGIAPARLPRGLDPVRDLLLRAPEGTGLLVLADD